MIAIFFPLDKAYSEQSVLEKKFKSMGIIKLAGISPPATYDLVDMNGNSVKLSNYNGKIIFLNFWTTWCLDCVREMPDIEKLHKKIDNSDFIVLAIDLKESTKKVKKFIAQHKLTFTVLIDQKGDMGRAFGIRSIPTTFILNRKGGLIGKAMGARDWDSRKALDLFRYLLESQ